MNILLLNGGKAFGHSHGELNAILHNEAKTLLSELGHQVQETHIDAGYDIETEIEKYLWADAVIYQMPGWWMGEPWIVKKYMDEVFTIGHGKLYQSDGRHRVNPTEGYAQVACCKGGNICFLSLGTHQLKPLPARVIFSTAWALMACICTFTKPTNFSALPHCQPLFVMM